MKVNLEVGKTELLIILLIILVLTDKKELIPKIKGINP